MNKSELIEPLGDDVGTVAINFNDVMQEYLDSSDPDLNIPLSRIFQWFFDKGQEAMKEKAALREEVERLKSQPVGYFDTTQLVADTRKQTAQEIVDMLRSDRWAESELKDIIYKFGLEG